MNRKMYLFLIASLILAVSSCAGGMNSSVQPNLPGDSQSQIDQTGVSQRGANVWGLWDIEWNPDANTFDAIPLRSASFAVNVMKFINKSPMNLTIKLNSIQHDAGFVNFDIDISLRHPFPGLNIYTGFDVMGVLMGQGSATYPGPEGFPIAGPNDQQLLNADGYTRRWNASEFAGAGQILPLQGYFPGNKGNSGYVPTAVLNPYKYYADGLDTTSDAFAFLKDSSFDRGCFRPGGINSRNFKIRMSNSLLKFQYAIVANWEPNVKHPNPPASLDDFPASANSQEAVAISVVDLSDAYFENATTYGGDIALNVTPWDWSATCNSDTMEEYSIKLYSTAWTGAYDVLMTPIAQGDHQYTFNAKVPAETLSASGSLPVWIEIDYPGYDYTSPVGVPNNATGELRAYFKTEVNILDKGPTPEGDYFIYGLADSNFFDYCDNGDNKVLFKNMLDLPLTGPFANNKEVMLYRGHDYYYSDYFGPFQAFVESLGYLYVFVDCQPYVPLDTTGVKMLLLGTWYGMDGDYYTPEEIQTIKKFVRGGGICIIITEFDGCYYSPYGGKDTVAKLLTDLKLDISCPIDGDYHTIPFTDITPDPITVGVNSIYGACTGRFVVFGDAVSLVSGIDSNMTTIYYTSICKAPLKD